MLFDLNKTYEEIKTLDDIQKKYKKTMIFQIISVIDLFIYLIISFIGLSYSDSINNTIAIIVLVVFISIYHILIIIDLMKDEKYYKELYFDLKDKGVKK